jgi:hypothetical protein
LGPNNKKKGNAMSATANPVAVISLSEGFGAIVVQGDRIRVEISPEGHINVRTPGRVTSSAPTCIAASAEALKVGASMPDGTIYAGVSPDTGKPIYAMPKDAPMHCDFNQTAHYAANLDAHGRKDWRAPTKAELNVLFRNRAAIGGFDTTGSDPAGWYWSSSRYYFFAWAQRFSDGYQNYYSRDFQSALRCVRG